MELIHVVYGYGLCSGQTISTVIIVMNAPDTPERIFMSIPTVWSRLNINCSFYCVNASWWEKNKSSNVFLKQLATMQNSKIVL